MRLCKKKKVLSPMLSTLGIVPEIRLKKVRYILLSVWIDNKDTHKSWGVAAGRVEG